MKEAGVLKEQLLWSKKGRAGLRRSVPVAEGQIKWQGLLALSSFVWDHVQFQTHPKASVTVIKGKSLDVHVRGARDTFSPAAEIWRIEQRQLSKHIHSAGARASFDTVPVPIVLRLQHAKMSAFHLYKIKVEKILMYHWSLTLYSLFQVLKSPSTCIRSLFVSLVPNPSQQLLPFFHVWGKDLESFCLWILASVSGRSQCSFRKK